MANAGDATRDIIEWDPGLGAGDLELLETALQLEARLLAYETAITRSNKVIPRSLAEFLEPSTR
jgi:hypothetical protein